MVSNLLLWFSLEPRRIQLPFVSCHRHMHPTSTQILQHWHHVWHRLRPLKKYGVWCKKKVLYQHTLIAKSRYFFSNVKTAGRYIQNEIKTMSRPFFSRPCLFFKAISCLSRPCRFLQDFAIWSNFNQFDPTWSNLIQFKPIWFNLIVKSLRMNNVENM